MKLFRLADWLFGLACGLSPRPGPAGGVLIISAGGLGDTVLFAFVVERLAGLARDGEAVTVLLRRDAAKMAFLMPPGVLVRAVDFARLRKPLYRWRQLRGLYRAHYRLVIASDHLRHPDLDEALVRAAAAPQAVAMEPRSWPKHAAALAANRALYSRLIEAGPLHLDKVVRWTRFADALTGETQDPPVLRMADGRLPPPEQLARPTVVIQPFSAVKAKQSPPALYEKILAGLPAGIDAVVTGAPRDIERNPELAALRARQGVRFDDRPFAEIVPLLRAASLVVSVDTALMHLAAAVGAPTLCLASAAYVGEIVPYAAAVTPGNVEFVYQPMECEGCLGACVKEAVQGMFPCVAAIDEGAVMAAVQRLLAAPGPAD